MKTALLLLTMSALVLGARAYDPGDDTAAADREAVHQAVDDYVTAVYEAKPELIERSVSKELTKFGFYRNAETGEYSKHPMTYDELHELSKTYKDSGYLSDDPPKAIQVFEVLDKIANVKLTADWGVDYMQLAKEDGSWKIAQVIWQSPPQ
jgi:hypothetical protein